MQPDETWYYINNVNEIESPSLVVYLDRVMHNIALAIEMIGDASRLRPHVKTHKSVDVTRLLLQAGVTKFKCATIAEAEMLAIAKAPDVLLAYQPVGPNVERFLSLIKKFPATHFSCLVDSAEVAKEVNEAAIKSKIVVDVFVDVNVGMNRTGISAENIAKLFSEIQRLPAINATGLHGYDGHINESDPQLRGQRTDDAFQQLVIAEKCFSEIFDFKPIMIVGGSPTFSIHAKRETVECSPGTFVYWDKNYSDAFPDLSFLPAVLLITRVVSIGDTTICLDCGHKAIAAENILSRRIYFLNAPGLVPISQSEEHLVVAKPANNDLKIGEVLYGMPHHVCPTVALHETIFVVENGSAKKCWPTTARRRKLSI